MLLAQDREGPSSPELEPVQMDLLTGGVKSLKDVYCAMVTCNDAHMY